MYHIFLNSWLSKKNITINKRITDEKYNAKYRNCSTSASLYQQYILCDNINNDE